MEVRRLKELPERRVKDSGRSGGGVRGASLVWRLFEVTYVLPVCLDSARMDMGLGNSDGVSVGVPGLGGAASGSCPGEGLVWAGGIWALA